MRQWYFWWSTVLALLCVSGCGRNDNGQDGTRSARVRVQIGHAAAGTSLNAAGAAVTRQRVPGIPAEVTDIHLLVTANGQDIAGSPFTIPLDTGTLTVEITANVFHTFTVEARNQRGSVIFQGSNTLTLAPGESGSLPITLEAEEISLEIAREFIPAATGGEVVVADPNSPVRGLRLTIPPGALSEDLTISITEVYNASETQVLPDQVGVIVDILPSAITFALPVTLTFPYDAALVEDFNFAVTTLLLHRFDPQNAQWVALPVQRVDADNEVIIAQLTSFSFYGIAGGGPSVPGNRPPVALDQALSLAEDTTLEITLTGSDADGDPLTFRLVDLPTRGLLQGTAPRLTYVPAANSHGLDTLTFVSNDGLEDSPLATITITVAATNDPPVVRTPLGNLRIDDTNPVTRTTIDLTETFADADIAPSADSLLFTLQNNTNPALVEVTLAPTLLTLTYQPNQNGVAAITLRATDQQGVFVEDTLQLLVERTYPFTLNLSRLNDSLQRIQQGD